MKRITAVLAAALLALLAGCAQNAGAPSEADRVKVFLEESPEYEVADNGAAVSPGSDVIFRIKYGADGSAVAADYSGLYKLAQTEDGAELILFNVCYPTRVRLTWAEDAARITYDANGGEIIGSGSTAMAVAYDRTLHLRPNTSIGVDRFRRADHSLVGWNTAPDGSGTAVGLGSRVTVPDGGLRLYAQWRAWNDPAEFTWEDNDWGVTITGYSGAADPLVVPERLGGRWVTAIGPGAFAGCGAREVYLPNTLSRVEDGAFEKAAVESLTFSDNIDYISGKSFDDCKGLSTLHIQVVEAPYGYRYRRESCYADKVDLLITARGQRKMVFYGGCAMWYNLDSTQVADKFGSEYRPINMGLNGTINSAIQMQIMAPFLEEGDILVHAPELSSYTQMMNKTMMDTPDGKLWCGMENNYDLLTLCDIRRTPGVLDNLCWYLSGKTQRADPAGCFRDEYGQIYWDRYGDIPFQRLETQDFLYDQAALDPNNIRMAGMGRLKDFYNTLWQQGVTVYVTYACTNMDQVPEEQQGNVERMETLFRGYVDNMPHATLISRLSDYLYHTPDFFDTNYHLRSEPTRENTAKWLRDLERQMTADGLWKAQPEHTQGQ